MMDVLRLLFLGLVMMSSHGEGYKDPGTVCENYSGSIFRATEGEALRVSPYTQKQSGDLSVDEFTWYKDDSPQVYLSSSEEERIHHHGHVLFLFNLSLNDTGVYYSRRNTSSGKHHINCIEVRVFPAAQPLGKERLFLRISGADTNPLIPCPESVRQLCQDENGNFTWYRNSSLLLDQTTDAVRVNDATKKDEAIYTCMCTWRHNNRVCNSSASRWLKIIEPFAFHPPEIISPKANTSYLTDHGSSKTLNCSAFCGQNINDTCHVWWERNGQRISRMKGFTETFNSKLEVPSKRMIFTAVLTIESVSADDFQSQFECVASNLLGWKFAVVSLRPRESLRPHILAGVCMLLLCLFAAVAVKYFAVDLTLLMRRFFRFYGRHEDGKVYDAYVVYQTQREDKALEDALCHFITNVLPSVLEHKCGFRLFIHGRDDLPGEDRLELVETRMKLSRRLMVILTPGSTSGSGSEVMKQSHTSPQIPVVGGYDWQVGIHQVLVQSEMSVILIQLGDMGPQDYTLLPPGLQHLVCKSAPLRWRKGSRDTPNSGFWKRVRYMMPVASITNKSGSII